MYSDLENNGLSVDKYNYDSVDRIQAINYAKCGVELLCT